MNPIMICNHIEWTGVQNETVFAILEARYPMKDNSPLINKQAFIVVCEYELDERRIRQLELSTVWFRGGFVHYVDRYMTPQFCHRLRSMPSERGLMVIADYHIGVFTANKQKKEPRASREMTLLIPDNALEVDLNLELRDIVTVKLITATRGRGRVEFASWEALEQVTGITAQKFRRSRAHGRMNIYMTVHSELDMRFGNCPLIIEYKPNPLVEQIFKQHEVNYEQAS